MVLRRVVVRRADTDTSSFSSLRGEKRLGTGWPMNRLNELLAPGLKYHVIATAPFIAACFLVPFELYYNGQEYWNFGLRFLLYLPAFGLLACAIVLVLLRLLAIFRPRLAKDTAVFLFCLGTFILVADLYSPLQISLLDGTKLTTNEPIIYSTIEIAFAVGLAFVFTLLRKAKYLAVAYVFSTAIIVISLAYGGLIVLAGREAISQVPVVRSLAGMTGNVYHIVLDEMQTDVFLSTLEDTSYSQKFEGFELFDNNIANYITTAMSLPSYFTGTFFHQGDLDDWLDAWQETGLLPTLNDSGYVVSMYSPNKAWNNRYVDRFTYLVDVYEEETGTVASDFPEFLALWMVRLAPNLLAREALALSGALREHVFDAQMIDGARAPTTIHGGRDSLASVFMLRRVIEDEQDRRPGGEYVYAHAILPHQPYVMDEDCRYDPARDAKGKPEYLAQARCAVRLVSEFLAELKRLGRYDAATVIVHGDTGSWTGFSADPVPGRGDAADPARDVAPAKHPEVVDKLNLAGPEAASWLELQKRVTRERQILAARTSALLMIKRPYARGPLRVSDSLTQLVDVFPTVLDILNLDPPGYPVHGRSVYELDEGVERDARYGFRKDELVVEVRISDQKDLRRSELTIVGPATDPRFWRDEIRSPVRIRTEGTAG